MKSRSLFDLGPRLLRYKLSNICSKASGPVEAKDQPLLVTGTKVCSNGYGHMTKMATLPKYSYSFRFPSLLTKRPMTLKFGTQHLGLWPCKIYSNDDPGVTLTCFLTRSNVPP